jgi:hypothetical protein
MTQKKSLEGQSVRIEMCPAHNEFMQMMIESKQREAEYATTLSNHASTLQEILLTQRIQNEKLNDINRIVTNGLQANITSIKDSMDGFRADVNKFITSTREKLVEFDNFSWFRKPMNKFRDTILTKLIIIIGLVIVILAILHVSPISSAIIKYLTGGK